MKPAKREHWTSLLSFVWVSTGAAVGLGNIWKFPYMAGSNGGSAFVLTYLFFVVIIAAPLMIAEITLGKVTSCNAVDGFLKLSKERGRSKYWSGVALLGALTLWLVFCFYSVVAGWSVGYIYLGATNAFAGLSPESIQGLWVSFLSSPQATILCSVFFVAMTLVIVFFGVKKGIERACVFLMPALLMVLGILVIFSFVTGDGIKAIEFLFAFDPAKITPQVIISSLGHALFTLAVGACAMMVYGSYLKKETSVIKSVAIIAVMDTLVALFAGLAIFPLIFSAGLSPAQGPGLMFVSLPMAFSSMPFGSFFATLFFILLFFAALSSSLSFAEPLVDLFMEKTRMSRHGATYFVGTMTVVGAIICALSFNLWADVRIMTWGIFDLVADLSTNILLPVGALGIAIFSGLVLRKSDFGELTDKSLGRWLFGALRAVWLILAPLAILVVLVNGII